MVSDRMMQAIGSLERAITGLEQRIAALPEPQASSPESLVDPEGARAALHSLDALITELKGRSGG